MDDRINNSREYAYNPNTGEIYISVIKYKMFDIQITTLRGANIGEKSVELIQITDAIDVLERTNNTMFSMIIEQGQRISLEVTDNLATPNGTMLDGLTTTSFIEKRGIQIRAVDIIKDQNNEIKGVTKLYIFNSSEEQEEMREQGIEIGDNTKSIELSSQEAEESVQISNIKVELNRDLLTGGNKRFLAKILAHETGHAFNAIFNKISAWIWSQIGRGDGHDKNNPSGKEADKQENQSKQNYGN